MRSCGSGPGTVPGLRKLLIDQNVALDPTHPMYDLKLLHVFLMHILVKKSVSEKLTKY